ncbi:hypothetical protein [Novosphingobium beihaiensis]|uniref:Uncharacterized protein n=1 Tax=Novosphingobium beihaiensis TaxID=2930389 RepID=A0ABT0BW83_9SPHN|nr:hypothetical protein [Novosphingobium beihaiensis]MCJ2189076.1 hypothetical protein [Novosphingobium beihaiensis]
MGLFGGLSLSSINPLNIAQLAMGPAGWASLAASTMFSSFGQQVIQQLGTSLGLPQPMIDIAQAGFAGTMGDYNGAFSNVNEAVEGLGSQIGMSLTDIASNQSSAQSAVDRMVSMITDRLRESGVDTSSTDSGDGSLLMKIAKALGELLDNKMTQMANLSDDIGNLGTVDNKNQSKLGQLTGELQGLTQETSLLSNALGNTIKSIGEANTTLARKG